MKIGDKVAQIAIPDLAQVHRSYYFFSIFGCLGELVEARPGKVIVDFGKSSIELPTKVVVKYESTKFKEICNYVRNLHPYSLMTFVYTRRNTSGHIIALHPEIKVVLIAHEKEDLWYNIDDLIIKMQKIEPNQAFLASKRSIYLHKYQ